MIIEKLREEDISKVLELYKDILPFETSLNKSEEMYKKIISDENYNLLVAKENNEILGTMLGICCNGLAEPFLVIEDVVIKDGMRGKGIGKKLMKELDNFAHEKKCTYSILVSSDFRKEAHKFYEKVGFTDGVRGFRKVY
nr:GNAT family N-acetyltransferase [uncultured Clostridium sp.]